MNKKCNMCEYQDDIYIYGWDKFCDYFGKTGELRKCKCGDECCKFKKKLDISTKE